MKSYFPVHVHSHFSLLDGLSKPKDIVKRCEDIGVQGSALTDHGSISGHIELLSEMKEAGKKALLGCEFYVCEDDASLQNKSNKKLTHLCVIAKNTEGWRDMVEMVSMSNAPENYYYKPRLGLNQIFDFASRGNILAYSGHIGSHMSNILYNDSDIIDVSWKANGEYLARKFKDAFGDNFFLEVQLMDSQAFPQQKEIAQCIREIGQATGIPLLGTQDAHYASQEQAIDQRVLLCSQLRTTLKQLALSGMGGFCRSKQYHIPSYEEMRQWNTEEELDNTLKFADMVGDYDGILKNPVLPNFKCPDGMDASGYLKSLCNEGMRRIGKENDDVYRDRLSMEFAVVDEAKLSGYFLIMSDITGYCRNNKWLIGPGRGSAAGCLISYLTRITSIDPLKHDLIFERFYNAGRNTKDRVSMPDIDLDVPKYARPHVIEYIRQKYGEDKVGQMVTFQTIKGRGALKDVFRAHGGISFAEMNEITKGIIDESKISDELQKMKEDTGESSIIRWCLENTPKKLEKWCHIKDDGSFDGIYARRFEQAIRLEGTKSNQSKHAAGVIISPEPLALMCPMILDTKTKKMVAGFEMDPLEKIGGMKFDILGITMLDKIMGISQDLLTGEIHEIQ